MENIKDKIDEFDEMAVELGLEDLGNLKTPNIKTVISIEMLELLTEIESELNDTFIGSDGSINNETLEEWNTTYPSNPITPVGEGEDSALSCDLKFECGSLTFGE